MKKREYNFYDSDHYTGFGLQPSIFEIQIGYGLIPLVDKNNYKHPLLLKGLESGRNMFDAEYGIPLPPVHIVDNMELLPDQYKILFNGVEVSRWELKRRHILYADTGDVTGKIEGLFEKTKDPAFGMDVFFVPDDQTEQFEKAGYVCIPPERVLRTHFFEIVYQNRTKILNQCIVNTLVDKVRLINPDVISDVFFKKEFQTSSLKIVLNQLLAEDVSIRDMNTILETIADYIDCGPSLFQLVDHIRERLAFSILSKYADKNKRVHVIVIRDNLAEHLWQYIYIPPSKPDMPYFAMEPEENNKIIEKSSYFADHMTAKGLTPLFLIPSEQIRLSFANLIKDRLPKSRVISSKEADSVKNEFSIKIEGELDWNE